MINKKNTLQYLKSQYLLDDINSIVNYIGFNYNSHNRVERFSVMTVNKTGNYATYTIETKDIEDYISKQRDQLINNILND